MINENILFRDMSMDEHGDRKFILILLEMMLVWVLPIFALILFPMALFTTEKLKEQGSPEQIACSWILLIGIPCIIALIFCWNRSHIYRLGNRSLYFILDKNNDLHYAHIGSGELNQFFRKNISIKDKIKFTPRILIYGFFFLFRNSYGPSKTSFMKQQLYYELNLKEHIAERLLTSESYKAFAIQIFSVKKIKQFSKGCEITAVVFINGKEATRRFTIYNTTENYQLLMEHFQNMSLANYSEGLPLTAYQSRTLNRIIMKRAAVFIVLLIFIVLVLILRYLSYRHESTVDFFIMRWLASRSMRSVIRGSAFAVIMLLTIFSRYIYDLLRPSQFRCVNISVDKWTQANEAPIKRIFSDFSYFVHITYNGKSVTLGVDKALWHNRDNSEVVLILRNNTPYCLMLRDC